MSSHENAPVPQQEAVLYTLQCRPKNGTVWTETAGYRDPMPRDVANRIAKQLCRKSQRVVYRSCPVNESQEESL